MENLNSTIAKVKDPETKEALMVIAEELQRIKSIHPVDENLKQVAYAINRITGKLK